MLLALRLSFVTSENQFKDQIDFWKNKYEKAQTELESLRSKFVENMSEFNNKLTNVQQTISKLDKKSNDFPALNEKLSYSEQLKKNKQNLTCGVVNRVSKEVTILLESTVSGKTIDEQQLFEMIHKEIPPNLGKVFSVKLNKDKDYVIRAKTEDRGILENALKNCLKSKSVNVEATYPSEVVSFGPIPANMSESQILKEIHTELSNKFY